MDPITDNSLLLARMHDLFSGVIPPGVGCEILEVDHKAGTTAPRFDVVESMANQLVGHGSIDDDTNRADGNIPAHRADSEPVLGCPRSPFHRAAVSNVSGVTDVELLYFDDCPNWRVAERHLGALAAELGHVAVRHRTIDTLEEAERVGFRGSPTVLVNGVDPFATASDPVGGLSCRVYQTPGGPAGSPTIEQLREALTFAK